MKISKQRSQKFKTMEIGAIRYMYSLEPRPFPLPKACLVNIIIFQLPSIKLPSQTSTPLNKDYHATCHQNKVSMPQK